jgi:hypothetical protein
MRLIRSLLTMPADLGIARDRWLRGRLILRLEALVRRPRLQQRAIHGEVIRRDVAAQLRRAHDSGEELIGDPRIQESLTVLGERRRIERWLIDAQIQEPENDGAPVAPGRDQAVELKTSACSPLPQP